MKSVLKTASAWLLLGSSINKHLPVDSVMRLSIVNIIAIIGTLHILIINLCMILLEDEFVLADFVAIYSAIIYTAIFAILHTQNGMKHFNILKIFLIINVMLLYGYVYGNIWAFLLPTIIILLMELRIGIILCLGYLTLMFGVEFFVNDIRDWRFFAYYSCIFLAQIVLACTYEVLRIRGNKKLQKEKEKIELISITDHLTKLFNRRHFEKTIERELAQATKEKDVMSFLMLDVDNFKNYNDTYGHLAGDELLVSISKILKKVVKRSGDFVFRMGGEEFGVLLTKTEASGAAFLAERIRAEVERKGKTTISIGRASIVPQASDTSDSLLRLADSNLYKAKDIGKNMVVG